MSAETLIPKLNKFASEAKRSKVALMSRALDNRNEKKQPVITDKTVKI